MVFAYHYYVCRFSPLVKVGLEDGQELLQHAQFVNGPEGRTGVIFVVDNDIYYIPNLNKR